MAQTDADAHIFCSNFRTDLHDDVVKVSSINATFPKVQTTTGFNIAERCFRPGRPSYGNITFQGAEHVESVKKMRAWIKDAYDGKPCRKNITIEIRNQKQEVVRTYNLMETLPVAFSSIDFNSQGGHHTMHWICEVRVQQLKMA